MEYLSELSLKVNSVTNWKLSSLNSLFLVTVVMKILSECLDNSISPELDM